MIPTRSLPSGDMTWELGHKKNIDKLMEYECKLEALFHEILALNGICQYHMNSLPINCIEDALYTHKTICINETIGIVNPYHLPPEVLPTERPVSSLPKLQDMLEQIGLPPYSTNAAEFA